MAATFLDGEDVEVAAFVFAVEFVETGVEFAGEVDAIIHGVLFADVGAEGDVAEVGGDGHHASGHGSAAGEVVGEVGGEVAGAVSALGDAHHVDAVGIDFAEEDGLADGLFEDLDIVGVPPAAEAVVGHTGEEVEACGFINSRGEAHLGLPFAGVDIPAVGADFVFPAVLAAAVHGDEEGPAVFGFVAPAEEDVGHFFVSGLEFATFDFRMAFLFDGDVDSFFGDG